MTTRTSNIATLDPEAKDTNESTVLLPGRRRRINIVAILLNIFVPWFLFILCLFVLSFSFHYNHSPLAWTVVIASALVGVSIGLMAIRIKTSRKAKDPKWYGFASVLILLAVFVAMVIGDLNFWNNMHPYYDVNNLATYTGVNPAVSKGAEHMDAGIVYFTVGSRIDESKSIGFKNLDTYCVAPITNGNKDLDNYDYFAVGTNCCSPDGPTFTCGDAKNPNARYGLRLMKDDERQFYRLAVQQSEAAYNIQSSHPLFFYWVADPVAEMNAFKEEGYRVFLLSIFSYFAINLFFVVCGVLAFSRLSAKR